MDREDKKEPAERSQHGGIDEFLPLIENRLIERLENRLDVQIEKDRRFIRDILGLAIKILAGAVIVVAGGFAWLGIKTVDDIRRSSVDTLTAELRQNLFEDDSDLKRAMDSILSQSIVSSALLKQMMGHFDLTDSELRRLLTVVSAQETTLDDFYAILPVLSMALQQDRLPFNRLAENRESSFILLKQTLGDLASAKDAYGWMRQNIEKRIAVFDELATDELVQNAIDILQEPSSDFRLLRSAIRYLGRSKAEDAASTLEHTIEKTEIASVKMQAISSLLLVAPQSRVIQEWAKQLQVGDAKEVADALDIFLASLVPFYEQYPFKIPKRTMVSRSYKFTYGMLQSMAVGPWDSYRRAPTFNANYLRASTLKEVTKILDNILYRGVSVERGICDDDEDAVSRRRYGSNTIEHDVDALLDKEVSADHPEVSDEFSVTEDDDGSDSVDCQPHLVVDSSVDHSVDVPISGSFYLLINRVISSPGAWPNDKFLERIMKFICISDKEGKCTNNANFRILSGGSIVLDNGDILRRGDRGTVEYTREQGNNWQLQVKYRKNDVVVYGNVHEIQSIKRIKFWFRGSDRTYV